MLNLYKTFNFSTLAVFIIFTLSSCALCPFGTSSTTKGGYQAIGKPRPSHSINKQMQLCRAECVDTRIADCSTILEDSSNFKLINQATGEEMSEKAALRVRDRCEFAKSSPAFHEEQCASSNIDTCMKENGYDYRRRDVTVCKPMKVL
jgi:hypothetical protein